MRVRSILTSYALMLVSSAAPVLAQQPWPAVGADLKATIALHGFQCDHVVESKRNADSDYTATCKDGHRYRVYVDSTGRVMVHKL